jgi:hypothetical protein
MDQRKSALPLQVLPVAPREAIPTTPQGMIDMLRAALSQKDAALSQKDEELADAKDMGLTVLRYVHSQRADRTARARRAGSTPKQKIAEAHIEMVEVWLAEMDYRLEHGIRVGKTSIDRLVGTRFEVDYKTVERARVKAGYK